MTDINDNKISIDDTIGDALRAAREEKQWSITEAADQTNLNPTIIQLLEANDFKNIGAFVFTRGYLNSYARALGLNADEIVQLFNRLYPDTSQPRISSANAASQTRSFKRNNIAAWLTILPILIVAAALAVQIMNPNSWLITQFKATFAPNAKTAPATGENLVVQIGTEPPETAANTALPPPELPELTSLETPAPQPEENTALINPTTPETTTTESPAESSAPEQNNALAPENASTAQPTATADASKTIRIEITGENWVEVRDSNRKILYSKTFKSGESIELSDGQTYTVSLGRPQSANLMIAGQPADWQNYRVEGNQRRFRIGTAQ